MNHQIKITFDQHSIIFKITPDSSFYIQIPEWMQPTSALKAHQRKNILTDISREEGLVNTRDEHGLEDCRKLHRNTVRGSEHHSALQSLDFQWKLQYSGNFLSGVEDFNQISAFI